MGMVVQVRMCIHLLACLWSEAHRSTANVWNHSCYVWWCCGYGGGMGMVVQVRMCIHLLTCLWSEAHHSTANVWSHSC